MPNKKTHYADDEIPIFDEAVIHKRGDYGTGDYEVQVDSDKDLEYIMSLIKQVVQG